MHRPINPPHARLPTPGPTLSAGGEPRPLHRALGHRRPGFARSRVGVVVGTRRRRTLIATRRAASLAAATWCHRRRCRRRRRRPRPRRCSQRLHPQGAAFARSEEARRALGRGGGGRSSVRRALLPRWRGGCPRPSRVAVVVVVALIIVVVVIGGGIAARPRTLREEPILPRAGLAVVARRLPP